MEILAKLERQVLTWTKDVPHLPPSVKRWLGDNIWWIVLILAISAAISVLYNVFMLLGSLFISPLAASYYAAATFVVWVVVSKAIAALFAALEAGVLFAAVKPLKAKQKKGWVLLFVFWLVSVLSTVVGAIITLSPLGVISGLIFGGVWLAVSGYFLFEIHDQFAHVERSKGVQGVKEGARGHKKSTV